MQGHPNELYDAFYKAGIPLNQHASAFPKACRSQAQIPPSAGPQGTIDRNGFNSCLSWLGIIEIEIGIGIGIDIVFDSDNVQPSYRKSELDTALFDD